MIWQFIIPAIATITVAIIEAKAAKERKQTKEQKDKEEQREQRRAEESRLSMQMMYATLSLSLVTANALTGGHNNGNVEAAKQAATAVEAEYQAFLQKVAAEQLAKK